MEDVDWGSFLPIVEKQGQFGFNPKLRAGIDFLQ